MKNFALTLAVACVVASPSTADDALHPYHLSRTSAHSSLSPGSPQWFRPGRGYVTPSSLVPQRSIVPYLSLKAETPFEPYTFRQLNEPVGTLRTYRRASRVWPVPGDIEGFRIDALRHYGSLPGSVGSLR